MIKTPSDVAVGTGDLRKLLISRVGRIETNIHIGLRKLISINITCRLYLGEV